MSKVAIVIAPDNFQPVEYAQTVRALTEKSIDFDTASTVEAATAVNNTKQPVDINTVDIRASEYDAIVLIGGGGSHIYFHDLELHQILNDFANQHKIIAAICAAPAILAYAGLLRGKKATCFPSHLNDLKSQGAIYTGDKVSEDGLIITGDGPESAYRFGQLVASKL
jgi:protease I